jgi:NADPH:quinone reductase-like Zn-dependent oxidoreductase
MTMTDTMRAMIIDRFGGPDVLTLADRPRPRPGPTEILVRVRAAGVNPVDWKTRAGNGIPGVLGDPPIVLGWDVAGVVEEVSLGVTRFAPGDRVFGMPHFPREAGAYAEYVVAPSRQFARVPDGLDLVAAATLPLAALTAWQALVDTAGVGAGHTVLVHGAAGGVGHLAVQIAKARGARVIGTSRAARHALLRALGVDEAIDYTAGPFEKQIGDVDIALDPVGGDYGVRSIDVLKPGGQLVRVSGGGPDVAAAAARAGVRHTSILVEPDGAALDGIAALVRAGQLRPVIAGTFPLADAAEAHRVGEEGHIAGKLVLTLD